jgi:hypothetical protein
MQHTITPVLAAHKQFAAVVPSSPGPHTVVSSKAGVYVLRMVAGR